MPIRFFFKLVIYLLLMAMMACGKKENHKEQSLETIKIESKPNVSTVYYSGIIKPIESFEVTNAKAEGLVTEVGFTYGQRVNKGELLFVISSVQFAKDYQSALSEYIKSAQNLSNVKFQMTGTEELKKLKIVSEQEYLNVKSQLFNAELDTAQSERRFTDLLSNSGVSKEDVLKKLDINNPKAIIDVLSKAPNIIRIYAPISGTALVPAGKESGELHVGSEVKTGQTLVSIVNETGLLIIIKITELDVNNLKVNQKAIIRGDAFPGIELNGLVEHIDRTANADSSGGIPTFSAHVVYPHLTPYQDEIIRVGMRAEIAIPFTTPAVIKIPLTAVFNKGDQSMVKRINKKTGKIEDVPVQTRGTDVNTVEITGGLNPGDEVVVHATTD